MKPLAPNTTKVYANGLVPCPRGELPDARQIEICRRWLRAWCTPRKRVNERITSYGLKHIVENWAEDYVTNGAFIAAAIAEGYRVYASDRKCPNALFNIAVADGALNASAAGAGREDIADLQKGIG